jgi:hypothetical protein
VARPDDRLLGTPQTAQEGTDEIIRSQQVRDRLLQDLGFLAFTLPGVELLMPTKLHFLQSCQHLGRVLDEYSTDTTTTWLW